MTHSTSHRAPAVTATALQQEVARLLQRYRGHTERVLLVRAHAPQNSTGTHTVTGQPVRLIAAVSPLDAVDRVASHDVEANETTLVLLTDAAETELGEGLLSRALGHRVHPVAPWRIIQDSFGVQRIDPRLSALDWVDDALLDAMPPEGWPRQSGPVLGRDAALRHLAARRLNLAQLGLDSRDLDGEVLLRWSLEPELIQGFSALGPRERVGIQDWLREATGSVADVLAALLDSGGAIDCVALGVLCAALWSDDLPNASAGRAQGAVLHHIAAEPSRRHALTDQCMREFSATTEKLVRGMLGGDEENVRRARQILDRAESLAEYFGAGEVARSSPLLRSGLDHRLHELGIALGEALDAPTHVGRLHEAVKALREHVRAAERPERTYRAEMALRIVRWLAAEEAPASRVTSVAAGLEAQIASWGWVDRAAEAIWVGEERRPELQRQYLRLYEQTMERRRAVDAVFAHHLANTDSDLDGLLTVENLLPRVVAPVATDRRRARPVLLLVVDGMNAAVAAALGEQMHHEGWEEYDPLAGEDESARRRVAAAAFPTITHVSRASLFSAELTRGSQSTESVAFSGHRFWKSKKAALFHKGDLPGEPGQSLGEDLVAAMQSEVPVVAVVLNTVDDSLEKGRADTPWRIDDVAHLRDLLEEARAHERAVILTSDHGHVLEHGGEPRRVDDAEGARYRTADTPPGEGEVGLSGPRVVHDDGRIVALWDPRMRYTSARAGYHGGASLAEVAVPVMVFLPFAAVPPSSWRVLPEQRPAWWSADAPPAAPPAPSKPVPARRTRRAEPSPDQEELQFQNPVQAASTPDSLVDRLLSAELFDEQWRAIPRKPALEKVRAALDTLIDAGGVASLPQLAERVGDRPVRAAGLAAQLARILNVDNYPVLEVIDGGRNVRLDVELLRTQFGLKG